MGPPWFCSDNCYKVLYKCPFTREFRDLNGVGMALEAKTSQTLPAILVGKVEVPHQVLCGGLLHVQLISILLVEETHFLPAAKTISEHHYKVYAF